VDEANCYAQQLQNSRGNILSKPSSANEWQPMDKRRNIYSLTTFHAYVVSAEDQSEAKQLRPMPTSDSAISSDSFESIYRCLHFRYNNSKDTSNSP
jgi:hypothetical protein